MEEDNRIWLQKLRENNVGYSFENLPLEDEVFARVGWNKHFDINPYGFVGERSIFIKNGACKEDVLKYLDAVIVRIERANLQIVLNDWVFEKMYLEKTTFPNTSLEINVAQRIYPQNLLSLFRGHKELIDSLIGKSDNEIAKLITGWAKQKDKSGKPLIENPSNRMQSKFAKELKQNGLIGLSEESFRRKL